MRSESVLSVIRAYDDPIVRAYCWGRFWILRQRFLDEVGQYLPRQGRVLDLGCGFGLFSLYYASVRPGIEIEGIDLSERRIATARKYLPDFGLGAYCGFGRLPPAELPNVLADHVRAVEIAGLH